MLGVKTVGKPKKNSVSNYLVKYLVRLWNFRLDEVV